MPLPRDDHNIPGARLSQGRGNGLFAVNLAMKIAATRYAGGDIGEDPPRVFTARIVRGLEGQIGQLAGDLAHLRPLASIPVSATAKDADQAMGLQLAGGGQNSL